MNLSGITVAELARFHKIDASDILVIHDELDLPPFQMKLKTGGGAGGHNGLKSIDECLGAAQNGYHRLRMGIGHPRTLGLPLEPADYVLQKFNKHEIEELPDFLADACEAIELFARGDLLKAMNKFNQKKTADKIPDAGAANKKGKE